MARHRVGIYPIGKAMAAFTFDDDRREVFVVCVAYSGADWTARVETRLPE